MDGGFSGNSRDVICINNNGVEYFRFRNLSRYGDVIAHCFTSRIGGVSRSEFASLNLGINGSDSKENVLENFRRISEALGIEANNLVFSKQVHGASVFEADYAHRGIGMPGGEGLEGYDALVTDKRGVALATFHADCVPVFLFDPPKRAIALAHSGWRGTVKEISGAAVRKMESLYGCDPETILAAIGPSIGQCCFEVGVEVGEEFVHNLRWSLPFMRKNGTGKWNIDLWGIVRTTLVKSGIKEENICVSGICTKCRNDLFYSYRRDGGKTGSMAAIMQII